MDKLSMAILFGATSQAPLPPVPTWWVDLPTSSSYFYNHCFGGSNVYTSMIRNDTSSGIFTADAEATLRQSYTISSSNLSRGYDLLTRDANGNFYFAGSSAVFDGTCHVVKYNSSMVKQWERSIAMAGDGLAIRGLAVDSSLNVYVLCAGGVANNQFLTKFSSAGATTFSRSFSGLAGDSYCDLAIDGLGNVYFHFEDTSNGSQYLASYSSTGTLNWQRTFVTTNGTFNRVSGLAGNPSGGVYVAMIKYELDGTTNTPILVSINSTGASVWARWMANTVQSTSATARTGYFPYVNVDAGGNPYLSYATVGFESTIMKFSSAGANTFNRNFGFTACGPVVFAPDGVNMAINANEDGFVFKIPLDGSLGAGSYGGSYINTPLRVPQTTAVVSVNSTTAFTSSTVTMTINSTALTTVSGPTAATFNYGYVR